MVSYSRARESKTASRIPSWHLHKVLSWVPHWWTVTQANEPFPPRVTPGHVYHNRKNLQQKGWYFTATVKDPRNLTAKVNGTIFQAALNRETAEAAACWAVPSSKAKFITNRGKIPSLPVSWLDLEHLAVTGDCCLPARNPQKAGNLPLL